MEANVKQAFPGRPDNASQVREIAVGEKITGDLARVAIEQGWADEVRAEPSEPEVDNDGLDKLKVDELKALAESETIDLGVATRKDDIIAAIRSAREAA